MRRPAACVLALVIVTGCSVSDSDGGGSASPCDETRKRERDLNVAIGAAASDESGDSIRALEEHSVFVIDNAECFEENEVQMARDVLANLSG